MKQYSLFLIDRGSESLWHSESFSREYQKNTPHLSYRDVMRIKCVKLQIDL